MAKQDFYDISVYSLGGSSILPYLITGSLSLDNDTQDGKALQAMTSVENIVGRTGTVEVDLLSGNADTRISHIDVTAFSLGGTDYLAQLAGGSLSCTITHLETKPVGGLWKYPRFKGRTFSISTKIMVDSTVTKALEAAMLSGTLADSSLDFSITIGADDTALPMVIKSAKMGIERGGLQEWDLTLAPQGEPTDPAGTTSLLQKAFNAPKATVAMVFTTHATEGMAYTANLLLRSFNFSWDRDTLISTKFTYATYGALAGVAN